MKVRNRDILAVSVIISAIIVLALVLTGSSLTLLPLGSGLSELSKALIEYSYCHCVNSSLSLAIVNAILWDFRGIDTFFETSVLFIAVIGGWVVYQRISAPKGVGGTGYSLIVRLVTRLSLTIAFIVSLALALNGHLSPGGGFQAGALLSTAIIVLIVVYGSEWVQRNLLSVGRALTIRTLGLTGIMLLAFIPVVTGILYGYTGFVFQNQAKPPTSFFNLYYEVDGTRYTLIILLYNVLEYVAVAAAFTLVFYTVSAIVFGENGRVER